MPFKVGGQKTGGRKKGTPNKTTGLVKDAIVNAFVNVGGEAYLEEVAKRDYKSFCTLLGRVLPLQVTGQEGGPIKVILGERDSDI